MKLRVEVPNEWLIALPWFVLAPATPSRPGLAYRVARHGVGQPGGGPDPENTGSLVPSIFGFSLLPSLQARISRRHFRAQRRSIVVASSRRRRCAARP
jgi:hypothetical protein